MTIVERIPDEFILMDGELLNMAKKRRQTISTAPPPFESGRVLDLFLAFILVMSICLKGSYFPNSYLLILIATGIWLLIRIPSMILPVFWKDPRFIMLGIMFLFYLIANNSLVGNSYKGILETFKIAAWLLFFLAVSLSQDKHILYRGIITGCLMMAVFGLLTYLGIVEFPQAVLWSGLIPRLQSWLQYANAMALFMGVGYFLSQYLSYQCPSVNQRKRLYFYSYIFLLTLFLTYSRGGIAVFLITLWLWIFLQTYFAQAKWLSTLLQIGLAALTAVLIGSLISNGQPIPAFLVLILSFWFMNLLWQWDADLRINKSLIRLTLLIPPALLTLGGIGLLLTDRKSYIFSRAGTFLERVISMQDAGTILLSHPWFGIGPGSWSSLQFKYQTAQYTVRYVHNGFLQLALDAGLFALVCFLLILVSYYLRELQNFHSQRNYYELLPGIALGFILLHSLLDIGLSFTALLLIMAVILSRQPFSVKVDPQNNLRKQSQAVVKVLLSVLILIFMGGAGYIWNGEYLYNQGQKAVQNKNFGEGTTLLRESIPYRPGDAEVFLALAQTALLSQQNADITIGYLEQARKLDYYEPRYVEELINFAYQRQDWQEVYRYSKIFIGLKPRDPQGYLKANWGLQQMYTEGEIDQESYEQLKVEIDSARDLSTQTLHPLEIYLH